MAADLACDKFWVNKTMYHDAEKKYYENLAKLQRNRESCVEALGENKEETNNKKLRDTKKPVMKNHKNMSKQLDVDALRKELMNLEAKNAKNEKFNIKCNANKINSFEIIQRNEDYDLDKNDRLVDSEKKVRQKEVKEKKSKSEKKSKRTKEKEDDPLGGVGMAKLNPETFPKTSLAGEVAKARQHIKSSLECMDQSLNGVGGVANARFTALLEKMGTAIENLTKRVEVLEQKCASCTHPSMAQICPAKPKTPAPSKPAKDDDDDVDLFGSESEEEDEESKKIREQRLAEYAAKKSKKPALVAKSNIILDIKPWDDETDMKEMEKAVRGIEMDGLVWGASKLVPVAFKIFKLQISCVIEDDKVSVDLLTETLEGIEDYIQSVDIAAFNKV